MCLSVCLFVLSFSLPVLVFPSADLSLAAFRPLTHSPLPCSVCLSLGVSTLVRFFPLSHSRSLLRLHLRLRVLCNSLYPQHFLPPLLSPVPPRVCLSLSSGCSCSVFPFSLPIRGPHQRTGTRQSPQPRLPCPPQSPPQNTAQKGLFIFK